MSNKTLKTIVTKTAGTWVKEGDTFPEIIRSEDGTIVQAEYVELPNGELMIMEYEIDAEDQEQMKKVRQFENSQVNSSEAEPVEKDSKENLQKKKLQEEKLRERKLQEEELREERLYQERLERYHKIKQRDKQASKKNHKTGKRIVIAALACCLCIAGIVYFVNNKKKSLSKNGEADISTEEEFIGENALAMFTADDDWYQPSQNMSIQEIKEPDIHPHCVESTKPSNLVASTAISVDGEELAGGMEYKTEKEISFSAGVAYSSLPGVITFRGNNYRDNPTYGYAQMHEYNLETIWSKQTGALTSGENTWSGSGWTGQPLIVQWPADVRQHMNMYDWAKEKEDLVEVIYACMDGYIYFLDLTTGEPTRDAMNVGYTFKGAGALDPRGYPIMYVGAGINSDQGPARVFVINLLDCSIMYTFGNTDPFAPRGVNLFDSSALVDAETDTLIYPGENGVIYFVKLGTKYDEKAGTLSINPESTVKWTYRTHRNGDQYWYGMEDSAVVYKGYLYIMDNGGDFLCLDLNTLELVWVQDCLDDSNGTPVLSIEGDKVYLYASTSFHYGWRSSTTAPVPIWKIDAETGEIVWQTEYECQSIEDLSGGVQSTMAVGREGLDDYVYVTVSRTNGMNNGVLACISKEDGKVVWEHEAAYAWSSPVCVYNSDGSGFVIYCSSNGKMYLLDGITGEQLDAEVLSEGVIEASPAVYRNCAVVGTRNCSIKCVWLK